MDRYLCGQKLRAARDAARLTALDLGKKSRVTEARVFALERGRGKLHADEARDLARALEIDPAELAPQWFVHAAEGGDR